MYYTVAINIVDKNYLRGNIVFESCKWGILAFEKIEEKEGLELRGTCVRTLVPSNPRSGEKSG